jgi:signal transduction histidine kinase/CheY-like chemotaxis protein
LVILNAISGTLWGSLMWTTLDTASAAGSILAMSVVTGMAAGAVSTQSPVLPIFVAFITAEMAVTIAKLWSMPAPDYHVIGVGAVLYSAAMLGQARNSFVATRAAIELRFENVELVEQLRVEADKARAASLTAEHAQQQAEQANLAKSRFLAAVSHDLRQPIHAQGLFLNVLADTDLDARQQYVVANIRAAATAAGDMLHTLLDFSRIEAGAVTPNVQAFRLQPLLNKIEAEFMPQADAKHLAYRSRETDLVATSDQALVELILRNLVSNAIRYTHHGGVLVACRKRGGSVVLEVYDTGIGIEASQQQEIFREFHQLGNPERDRHKGLGLGLAIVEGLGRTLGHTVSLSSVPGRGSVFRLVLPMANATDIKPGNTAQPQLPRKNRIRILLVDDDEAVRIGTKKQLLKWGFECDAVESAEEGLAVAKNHPPSLVISDYRLRDHHTGAEVVSTLRTELNPLLPALLITGDTAPERIQEAMSYCIPLLHKPVSPSELYRAIVESLATRDEADAVMNRE